MSVINWILKIFGLGWLLGLLWKYFKHTPFYEKHLAKPLVEINRYVFGPRIQIRPLPIEEWGYEPVPFHRLRIEIINQYNLELARYVDWKNVASVEEKINLFISRKPLDMAMVYIKFFNSNWELLPEPRHSNYLYTTSPSGTCLTIPPNGKDAIGVAGLLKSGQCYGTTTGIGERWLWGGGCHETDIPLELGNYYIEVSIKDHNVGITYATSYFLLTNQGTPETFNLSSVEPPSGLAPGMLSA